MEAERTDIPLVSVVMAVRNGARFLPEAIESILDQTFTDFDFIIVDNGSTDQSLDIVLRYQESDSRIRVVHEPRPGQAVALNTGIAASCSRWIARMDADDVAAISRLQRQLEVLTAAPNVVALGTFGWIIGEQGNVVGQSRIGPTTCGEFDDLRQNGELVYLLHPSVIFSRDAGLALGGYRQEYAPAEDVEFWSRLADEHLVLALPEHLVSYRIHTASLSTQSFRLQMLNVRRARANMSRRREGLSELSKDQFVALERRETWPTRTRRGLRERSQAYYRHGGSQIAAKRPRGFLWLLASLALYPPLPLRRLRMQRVWSTLRAVSSSPDDHAPANARPRGQR